MNQETEEIKLAIKSYLDLPYRIRRLSYELDNFSKKFYQERTFYPIHIADVVDDTATHAVYPETATLIICFNESLLKRQIHKYQQKLDMFLEEVDYDLKVLRKLNKRDYLSSKEIEVYQVIEYIEDEYEFYLQNHVVDIPDENNPLIELENELKDLFN